MQRYRVVAVFLFFALVLENPCILAVAKMKMERKSAMYSFKNDYSEGAHPKILEALVENNMQQEEGYGMDTYCEEARDLLRKEMDNEQVEIHFFVGGTQTNLTALAAFLRPHEAVIAAHTGHILVHETGAIEATGHKVIAMESTDSKLHAHQVVEALEAHTDEHMVKPKLVYISNSTELGNTYSLAELHALRQVCDDHGLWFFMDGARLGSALCAQGNDVTLKDLAELLDAFYIGGTKNGALFGEALVIGNDLLKPDFRFHIKQRGGLLAKGRLLGLQFKTLFEDRLFFDLANHANVMADRLREALDQKGYDLLVPSTTNQVFPILPNGLVDQLETSYGFYRWSKVGPDHTAIRLVTSWATDETQVDALISLVTTYHG